MADKNVAVVLFRLDVQPVDGGFIPVVRIDHGHTYDEVRGDEAFPYADDARTAALDVIRAVVPALTRVFKQRFAFECRDHTGASIDALASEPVPAFLLRDQAHT